jgi:hypothetical protein
VEEVGVVVVQRQEVLEHLIKVLQVGVVQVAIVAIDLQAVVAVQVRLVKLATQPSIQAMVVMGFLPLSLVPQLLVQGEVGVHSMAWLEGMDLVEMAVGGMALRQVPLVVKQEI